MKFYGQFNPPVDKVIYERYFRNKTRGVSIECGAFDGLLENCTKFFEENFSWKTINIEPVPHVYENLVKNRPNSINLNVALSNEATTTNIRVYNMPGLNMDNGNGSINHTDSHREYLQKISNNKFKDYPIKTITYKELVKNLEITHLDLFVLDVEGHEPQVLQGMTDCDVLPEVFVIEHGHRQVGVFDEYLKKLKANYRLDHVSFVNSFYVKM